MHVCVHMCVHVYVDTKIDVWLYQMLRILFYRTVPFGGPESAYLATMAGQWSPGILLSLTPTPSLGLQTCCCTHLLRGCCRVKLRSSYLSGKHFNHWVTSPTVCDLLKSTTLSLPRTNLSLPPKRRLFPLLRTIDWIIKGTTRRPICIKDGPFHQILKIIVPSPEVRIIIMSRLQKRTQGSKTCIDLPKSCSWHKQRQEFNLSLLISVAMVFLLDQAALKIRLSFDRSYWRTKSKLEKAKASFPTGPCGCCQADPNAQPQLFWNKNHIAPLCYQVETWNSVCAGVDPGCRESLEDNCRGHSGF